MSKTRLYDEKLLHWIWEHQPFGNTPLHTTNGDAVAIIEAGRSNQSDGPDFTGARIRIGKLVWHGDIEIHWSAKDWRRHAHHQNTNFDQVILHVVYDDKEPHNAKRTDHSLLPTLCLKPYLQKPLAHFFEQLATPSKLPCAHNIAGISDTAFEKQIKEAHADYLEQKTNDLLQYYNPNLPLSKAWKQMVIIAFFDGLGIVHNRQPMRELATVLLQNYASVPARDVFIANALKEAGIQPIAEPPVYGWKRKGARPANRPNIRIRQACQLCWVIKEGPFSYWLRTDIRHSYKHCTSSITTTPGLGSQRAGILFGTVWIPAHYLLHKLLANQPQTTEIYDRWMDYRTKLPAVVTKPFAQASFPPAAYRHKLGTAYQLHHYCRNHRCHQCNVLKNAIYS